MSAPLVNLALATMDWNSARVLALRLKDARADCLCEQAERAEPEVGFDGTAPCWKRWESGIEDVQLPPENEWCATCRLRQRLHEAYRAAMKTRGIRLRAMQRAALHATKELSGCAP